MNAITTIEQDQAVALSLPDNIAFDEWVGLGRDLFQRRRQVDWLLADWFDHGRKHYANEEQMALFLEELGVDHKRIAADAKVAALIPQGWRSDRVSFEVAKEIAKVDDEDKRREMLQQAERERWNSKAAHHAVVEYRYETGDLFDDEDKDTRQAVELIRAWNRVSPEAREYFFALAELAAANSFTAIDEDRAI